MTTHTARTKARPSLTHPARTGYLLIAPAIVFISVIVLFPLVFALYISLTNWPLIGEYRFIGLANFADVFTDARFGKAIVYTLIYTGIVTVPILVLGYILAIIVRANRKGSTILRTIYFLPYVIGLTTLSFILVLEAQPNSGAINVVLRSLGITDGTTAWLVDGFLATIITCILVIYFASGLTMILLMSGMQGIPTDIYEAAHIDGATWWQRERQITIPLIRNSIALSVIISVIGSLLAFTQFFILTQGGPGNDTTTVVLYIYNRGFQQLQLGAATALSLILIVVIALVTALQFWLLRERD